MSKGVVGTGLDTGRSWHERVLTTETVFHVLAACFALRALLAASPEAAVGWIGGAVTVAGIGRVAPTERLDEALAVPILPGGNPEPEPPSEPGE